MSGRTCSARLFLVPFWQGDDDLHRAAGVQPPDGKIFRGAKRGKEFSGPPGRAAPGVVRSGPQVKIGWPEGHLFGVVVQGGASATLVPVDTEGGPCPASRCRTRDGVVMGGTEMLLGRAGFGTCLALAVFDALLAAWFLAAGSPGPGLGSRRSHHCSSWPRLCGVHERHARPRSRTRSGRPLNPVLPRHRCALACPRMAAGAGDGIGARSVARGGSAADVAQQHRSPPFVIMVGAVWWVRYSPASESGGPLLPNSRSEDPSRGLGPNSVTWGDHRVRAVAALSTP